MPQEQNQNLSIPVAIVIAGALIAGALYFGGGSGGTGTYSFNGGASGNQQQGAAKDVPKVQANEHIFGNPNAPIKIVEYTDLECPFCKKFHGTMKQVMEKYGASGQVAWVVRNFPLSQLHPNAPKLALAAECVADVGGNDAYWKFLDEVFKRSPINTFFDFTELDAAVSAVGVDVAKFTSCYDSGKHQDKIQKEFNDAVASGGKGTPFNMLVNRSGKNIEIPGAQEYDYVVGAIEAALK